ncbi:MAG: zinc-ribbon domain-containing protein [Acetatifactor sp.]|nr:zinc-ribbon domain-containing protein [Acetatifactor sp.]
MIVCPKCGKELADGTKFCSKCGTSLADVKPAEAPKAEEPKAEAPKAEAPKAEAPKKEEPKAEAPKKEEPKKEAPKKEEPKKEEPKAQEPKKEAPKAQEPKKEEAKAQEPKKEEAKAEEAKTEAPKVEGEGIMSKLPKDLVKYVAIGAAAIVALIILIGLFGGNKGGKHYALYLKDKEIMYSNLKPKGAKQVTAKLSKNGDITNEDFMDEGSVYDCVISDDGKLLFFPDKFERSDDGVNLFVRKLTNLKKEPVKMDSSVETYYVNDKATLVTYRKTTTDLYQYNVKKQDKEKIASEVSEFRVNDDGSRVVYRKSTGELYVWNRKDSEKIDSEVSRLQAVYDKTIYYVKDGTLYKKVGSKDKEKIASDVSSVVRVYESGQVYYVKSDDGKVLYYFDGKESSKVLENFGSTYGSTTKNPMLIVSAKESEDDLMPKYYLVVKKDANEMDYEKVGSVRFQSEGKFVYFIADMNNDGDEGDLYKASISGTKLGKADKVDSDVSTRLLSLNSDDKIYYAKDVKNGTGDLYVNKKKLDSDVYVGRVSYSKKTKQFFYLTDYSNGKGTLKVGKSKGKKVMDDVSRFVVLPDGKVLFLYDYSTKYYKGELYLYKGGKPVKLDDEVSDILYVR